MQIIKRLLTVSASLIASSAFASPQAFNVDEVSSSGLTKEQAKQVLIVVLKHEKYRLSDPGMYIDGDLQNKDGTPNRPGYFDFSLSYETPKAGATAYVGYYSVNIKTGDIWEVESCLHYRFPALRRLQQQITKRTGTEIANAKIARDEVGCPPK
jgi:hypothetical protein